MRNLFFILCFLSLSSAFCQTDSLKEEPYVYFNAFSFSFGFIGNEYQSHSPDDLKKLTSQNSIVNSNMEGYEQLHTNNGGNIRSNTGLNFHLKTKDFKSGKTRFSSEWRVGLYVGTVFKEKIKYSVKNTRSFDTIFSGNPTETVHIDDESDQRYQFTITGMQGYADITKTYHTDQLKMLSFYTGINFGIGYTFNNKLEAVTAPNFKEKIRVTGNPKFYPDAIVERTALPEKLFYHATVPVGAMVRISKKNSDIAGKMAVTAEARLGYRFDDQYQNNYNSVFIFGVQVGVKMYFNNYKG